MRNKDKKARLQYERSRNDSLRRALSLASWQRKAVEGSGPRGPRYVTGMTSERREEEKKRKNIGTYERQIPLDILVYTEGIF